MNAAFELLPLPASGSFVRRIEGQRGARLTAYAGVALIVKRKEWDPVGARVRAHVGHRPAGKRTHFPKNLAVGKGERLHLAEVRAARRLIAAQPGKPHVVGRKRAEERL